MKLCLYEIRIKKFSECKDRHKKKPNPEKNRVGNGYWIFGIIIGIGLRLDAQLLHQKLCYNVLLSVIVALILQRTPGGR